MQWSEFEATFSVSRVGRYKNRLQGNEAHAMVAYRHNLLVSEALTPFLCSVEVALRNAMNVQLARHYGRADWWEVWRGNPNFADALRYVDKAKASLRRRMEQATADKVVAELTFGFWSTLFNTEYQAALWQTLRKAFPHCPKATRQRATISPVVNRLRDLRNRAFHHEPILWVTPDVKSIHDEGVVLLQWIHGSLEPWLAAFNRLPSIWQAWQAAEAERQQPQPPNAEAT